MVKNIKIVVILAFGLFFSPEMLQANEGFGVGADINPNAVRLSIRNWFSKMNGFELGFGPSAKFEDFIFDDLSIQGKYLKGLKYDRFKRSYIGIVARYTMVKDPFFDRNLPSGGAFGGVEWYMGRYRNQGVAIEGGVMYGRVVQKGYVIGPNVQIDKEYKEFPLFLTFSYKYYFR